MPSIGDCGNPEFSSHPDRHIFSKNSSPYAIVSRDLGQPGAGIISRLVSKSKQLSARDFSLVAVGLALGLFLGLLVLNPARLHRITSGLGHRLGLSAPPAATPGQWGHIQDSRSGGKLTVEQKAEIDRLRSLGYAGGSVPAPDAAGVTIADFVRASRALRYYTSGHAPAAFLMDPAGKVLHRWQYSYDRCVKMSGDLSGRFLPDTEGATDCWRRARLLPRGELLAIFEGHGLIKIDSQSRLLWSYPGQCHHDLDLGPGGEIYVLTREALLVSRIDPAQPVLLDYITRLSPEGEFLDRIDILAAFENSVYAGCLHRITGGGDILHTNTLERLDGSQAARSPVFAAGNFLISVRELDTIAIIDGRTGLVVWALSGMWAAQHQPTLLDNGHILLFDNQGCGGRSKVLEIDPFTQEVAWSFADGAAHSLYSETCGSCQELPSGNILITESDNGRALETTRAGTIVWEYRNPRRAGKENEFIAAIMEMVMLPEDFRPDW